MNTSKRASREYEQESFWREADVLYTTSRAASARPASAAKRRPAHRGVRSELEQPRRNGNRGTAMPMQHRTTHRWGVGRHFCADGSVNARKAQLYPVSL